MNNLHTTAVKRSVLWHDKRDLNNFVCFLWHQKGRKKNPQPKREQNNINVQKYKQWKPEIYMGKAEIY